MYDDECNALFDELLFLDLEAAASVSDRPLSPYDRAMLAELEAIGRDDEPPEWVAELEAEVAASRCKIGSVPTIPNPEIAQENKGCEAPALEAPQCASHSTTYTPSTYPNINATGFLTPTDQTHRKSRRALWDGCEIATAHSTNGAKSRPSRVTFRQINTREPASPPANLSTAPVRQSQRVRQRIRRKSASVRNFLHKSWRTLSPVEKFAAAVWHSAEAGGLTFTLNLGIRREGMLLDHADPRTRMRKNLDKHLRAEGFGKLPIAWVGKLSCAGWVPHDRGFVLGLPRSKDRASTGRPMTGHEGSAPRSAPNPAHQAGSRCRWSWRPRALAGAVVPAIAQMTPAMSRAMAVMTTTLAFPAATGWR